MNYEVIIHENFTKEFKPLLKKYPSLAADFQLILDELENELTLATDLGDGFKKIRIKIKSKGKGASGGGRIITQETVVNIENKTVVFASIYNKGDYESVNISVLKEILNLV
jgi:mRNA-degrading endonuclease RelE of RelBE toxin-antitoxin system